MATEVVEGSKAGAEVGGLGLQAPYLGHDGVLGGHAM